MENTKTSKKAVAGQKGDNPRVIKARAALMAKIKSTRAALREVTDILKEIEKLRGQSRKVVYPALERLRWAGAGVLAQAQRVRTEAKDLAIYACPTPEWKEKEAE